MKTLYIPIIIFLLTGLFSACNAQQPVKNKINTSQTAVINDSFKVWGQCNMCKARIENAVLTEGAEKASWDSKTLLLSVTYDSTKVSRDALCKKLASVGHDTEKYRAPDDVYNKLPACCHYERNK